MAESKLAGRYAKSLMGLAKEQGLLDAINDDMLLIANTCRQNRDLRVMLDSPIIHGDKKATVIKMLFEGKINTLSLSFTTIILKKGREGHLVAIADHFTALYKAYKNIVTAVVTSAVALDEKLRNDVIALVKNGTKAVEVELTEKVNPALIGGLLLRVGDKQYDSTISTSLRRLTKDLSGNVYLSAN